MQCGHVQGHADLGLPPALQHDLGNPGQPSQGGSELKLRHVAQLDLRTLGRGEGEPDHREQGRAHQARIERRPGRELIANRGGEGLHPRERQVHVRAPVEIQVDLAGAATGGGAHLVKPRDAADALLQGHGHPAEHLVGVPLPAVGDQRDPRKGDLGQDRGGKLEPEGDPGRGEKQEREQDGPVLGL